MEQPNNTKEIKNDLPPQNAVRPRNLEEIVIQASRIGLEYVKVKKEADRLELMRPTRKAQAMERHDDGSISEIKLRRKAETDLEYIAFLNELADLRAKSEELRIRYESYKNLFEARRSMLSYQKAEMKLY